jgi:chemotaxis protein methyltransferase CheR
MSDTAQTPPKRFRIAAPILESATFFAHNLLHSPPKILPEIDLAFLRNVLIYFNKIDQQIVFNNVVTKLRPGGVLMIGHTESHSIDIKGFSRLAPAIYRKDA